MVTRKGSCGGTAPAAHTQKRGTVANLRGSTPTRPGNCSICHLLSGRRQDIACTGTGSEEQAAHLKIKNLALARTRGHVRGKLNSSGEARVRGGHVLGRGALVTAVEKMRRKRRSAARLGIFIYQNVRRLHQTRAPVSFESLARCRCV